MCTVFKHGVMILIREIFVGTIRRLCVKNGRKKEILIVSAKKQEDANDV